MSTIGLTALRQHLGTSRAALLAEVEAASRRTGRPVGVSEHLLASMDLERPEACPLRRQLLPMVSELEDDHPLCRADPLGEEQASITAGLVRRYPDRALLLTTARCPVYCAFCTRSWAVRRGGEARWRAAWQPSLATLEADPSIVDVTMSGGDVWQLDPEDLLALGMRLLALPQLERLRLASRGPVADPGRLLGDSPLLHSLVALARRARERGVRLAMHVHVNHPDELGEATRQACARLRELGITLRSQTVMLRGVNDSPQVLLALVRALVRCGVQPYYVYVADMAPGAEHLRTSLAVAVELEKQLRGRTAGFDTPGFVCDVLGGGGKRDVHSYERYDRVTGLAVFRSPAVDPQRRYLHADPLRTLGPVARAAWLDPRQRAELIAAAHSTPDEPHSPVS